MIELSRPGLRSIGKSDVELRQALFQGSEDRGD